MATGDNLISCSLFSFALFRYFKNTSSYLFITNKITYNTYSIYFKNRKSSQTHRNSLITMKVKMLVFYFYSNSKQHHPPSLLPQSTDYSSTLQLFTHLISHFHYSLYPTYCSHPTLLLLYINILLSHNLTAFALQ